MLIEKIENPDIWQYVKELEKEMDLPENFTWGLYKSANDWLFIISLHAFLESMVTKVLEIQYDEATFKTIYKLPLNGRTSKLGLIADSHNLPKTYIKFATQLSDLRNKCAHDITFFNFSLKEHLDNNPKELSIFVNNMELSIKDGIMAPDGNTYSQKNFIKNFPNEAILLGIIVWLGTLRLIISQEDLLKKNKEQDEKRIRLINELFQENFGFFNR